MRCPFCHNADTRVIDSRLASEGEHVRRRRKCVECSERFTTYESAELNLPMILKSDGRREHFSEDKLRESILRAVEKRPIPMNKVEIALARIKRKLVAKCDREVKSCKLGDWVMAQLRQLDHVAYVRFASVYRNFKDVRAFLDEIEKLQNDLPPEIRRDQLDLLERDGEEI